MLAVKEKDRIRKRNMAKMILTFENNTIQTFKNGDLLYLQGRKGDILYIVDTRDVKVTVKGEHILQLVKGTSVGNNLSSQA